MEGWVVGMARRREVRRLVEAAGRSGLQCDPVAAVTASVAVVVMARVVVEEVVVRYRVTAIHQVILSSPHHQPIVMIVHLYGG